MEINSLQGPAAYINASAPVSPVDNTVTREQNTQASNSTLDAQTTQAAQQAFEVSITQEARDRQAREEQTAAVANEPAPVETAPETPAQPVENPPETPPASSQNQEPGNRLVNIVA